MLKFDFSIDDAYTWRNAILWGNFRGHYKKAVECTGMKRVVHCIIAATELLPIISQITSIFEKLVVDLSQRLASQKITKPVSVGVNSETSNKVALTALKELSSQAIFTALMDISDQEVEAIFYHENETEEMLKKRANEKFGGDLLLAKASLIKEILNKWSRKADATGFSFALIVEVEALWRKHCHDKNPVEIKLQSENKRWVTIVPSKSKGFIPHEKRKVYLSEKVAGGGSYKTVVYATRFFKVNRIDERLDIVMNMSRYAGSKYPTTKKAPIVLVENGTTVVSGDVSKAPPLVVEGINLEKTVKSSEMVELLAKEELLIKEEGEKALMLSRRYKSLWQTLELIEIDGSFRFIQESAGFKTTIHTPKGEKKVKVVDLSRVLKKIEQGPLTIPGQIAFLKMIEDSIKALQELHEDGTIHRDVKPENFLCSKMGEAKISDIGELCSIKDNMKKKEAAGSPPYMSPEMCRLKEWIERKSRIAVPNIDISTDVWSLGISLWEMTSGNSYKDHPATILIRQEHSKIDSFIEGVSKIPEDKLYEEHYERPVPGSMAELVWRCARIAPETRPRIDEVLRIYQRWQKMVVDELQSGRGKSFVDYFDIAPKYKD